MSESYLSLKQLVELVDITENSCKRYMNDHEEFIRFDKLHNRFRIHASAVETLKTIRRLYGEGYKREAVDEYLRESGLPATITVNDKEGMDLVSIDQEVQELKNMFRVQQENKLQMQMQFNQNLVQQMEVEKEELKESFHQEIGELKQLLNRHESEKISELRVSLEEVSASVAVLKEERKKGFFHKLFNWNQR